MSISLEPIGFVRGGRAEPIDDHWGDVQACIEIDDRQFTVDSLKELTSFSHIVVVFYFHRVIEEKIEHGARHPRGNQAWPKSGIFAQRGKNRFNRLGVSSCQLLSVEDLSIKVQGLDAIDGTPVLDIKPYMSGFAPREAVTEPPWSVEIMRDYW